MSWIVDQDQVHMTVGSYVQIKSGAPDLGQERGMVKAALLYSDHTKLVSLPASLVLDMRDTTTPDLVMILRGQAALAKDPKIKAKLEELIESYNWAKRGRHSKRGRELF